MDFLDFPDIPEYPPVPSPVPWNDKYFENYYMASKLKKRPALADGIMHAKSFLNFYVYGEAIKHLEDTITTLLCTMAFGNHYVILDDSFNENVPRTLLPPNNIERITNESWQSSVSGLTVNDAISWYDKLFIILSKSGNDLITLTEQKTCLNYLGFIALQMMKTCIKDINTVSKHIMIHTLNSFKNLWHVSAPVDKTIPPTHAAMRIFEIHFGRFRLPNHRVLALCVYSHVNHPQKKAQSIFRAGALLSLSNVGLGCYDWLTKASQAKNVSIAMLLKIMGFECYRKIAKSIDTFMELFVNNEQEKTWPWARLFADHAFQDLATRANPEFAMVMMAITIDGNPDSHLWNILQFRAYTNEFLKEKCIKRAQAICKYIATNPEETITEVKWYN